MLRRFFAAFAALGLICALALSACSKETPEQKADRVAAEQAQKRSGEFESLLRHDLAKEWGPTAFHETGQTSATTMLSHIVSGGSHYYLIALGHNDRECHVVMTLVNMADGSSAVLSDSPDPTITNWSYQLLYIAPGDPVRPQLDVPKDAVAATKLSQAFSQRGIQRGRLESLIANAFKDKANPDHDKLAFCKPK